MTAATNTENLQQFKSRFFFIVEQIMAFPSSLDMVQEVKNMSANFKQIV